MMRSAAEAGLCPDSTLLTVVRSLESLGSTAALGRIEAGEAGGVQASGAVLLGPCGDSRADSGTVAGRQLFQRGFPAAGVHAGL